MEAEERDVADVESVKDKASTVQDLDDWYGQGEDDDRDLSSGHIWSLSPESAVPDSPPVPSRCERDPLGGWRTSGGRAPFSPEKNSVAETVFSEALRCQGEQNQLVTAFMAGSAEPEL